MKSNRPIHLALTIGALAVAPALAVAQTGGASPPDQQQQGARDDAQKPQGQKPGAAQGGQQAQQQGQKKGAMKLQEQVSFPVEDGCQYTASIKGKIQHASAGKSQQSPQGRGQGQAGSGQAQAGGQGQAGGQAQAGGGQGQAGGQERMTPDLTVSATMSCPNRADIRITETLKTDTPVPREELQEMISRRASIATEKGGRFCMYVPQFELTSDRLAGRGVTQLCRVPAQPEQQKQGMR